MFFLTEIDSRAAIKGSRDPLGLVPIWTRFGRSVVGNLTTVTTSVRGFTTLLIGLYFADEMIESADRDESERADLFLKFEQMCAYSRQVWNQAGNEGWEGILGITRVKRRLAESSRVTISAKQEHQILSNQKTYGLWGLYTVAARRSGLVQHEENRLTPLARAFVETQYLPRLGHRGNRANPEITRLLLKDGYFEPRGRHQELSQSLASILNQDLKQKERDLYSETLVLGNSSGHNHTKGRQHALWEILNTINGNGGFSWDESFSYNELSDTLKEAKTRKNEDLVSALDRIHTLEPLLAAIASAFSFLLMRDRGRLSDVATEIQKTWGTGLRHIQVAKLRSLVPHLEKAAGADGAARLAQMAEALHSGDNEGLVKILLEHNAAVMKDRGGAPWVSLDQSKLNVRLREETGELVPRDVLPYLWRDTYFLNSLKAIGATVFGMSA